MGLMTKHQEKMKEVGTDIEPGNYKKIAAMPKSAIARQQVVSDFEKELAKDIEALSMIRSIKEKEKVKAETLIPKYMPLVTTLMADGSNHSLLGQILVWCFDAGDIPKAMEIAAHCIEHDVPMPERFKRDLRTYLCDVVLEWAEEDFETGRSCEPYFSQVFDLAHGEKPWDLPDQVSGKFYRLRGMIAFKNEAWAEAVKDLEKAMSFGAKVKTLLGDAQKKFEDQIEAEAEAKTNDPE